MSKYQTLIDVCKKGDVELAKRILFNWVFEDKDSEINVDYAQSIINRYQVRYSN